MGAWIEYSCKTLRTFNIPNVGLVMEYECTCPDGLVMNTQIVAPWDDASLDADVLRLMGHCPTPPPEPPGECKIIGDLLHPLECGAGKTFTLNATMRNISNTGGYFIFRVFDGSSEVGASAKTYLSPNTQSGRNITCTMPSHDILLSNGRVELRRQT